MGIMPTTNASLMHRLKNGADEQSWRQFLDAYQPALLRWLMQRGLQVSDAEDCSQQVMLAVMKSLDLFVDDGRTASFRRWLQTIARHELINTLRKQSRQPRSNRDSQLWLELVDLASDEGSFSRTIHREYRRELFIQAAAIVRKSVQAATWEAFWRTSVLGKTAQVVADELGMKIGSVYMAKGRVLQRLQNVVQDMEETI